FQIRELRDVAQRLVERDVGQRQRDVALGGTDGRPCGSGGRSGWKPGRLGSSWSRRHAFCAGRRSYRRRTLRGLELAHDVDAALGRVLLIDIKLAALLLKEMNRLANRRFVEVDL